MHVCTVIFRNIFDEALDSDRLYNLVSGSSVNENIAQNLLSVSQTGPDLMRAFQSRLHWLNA